ncbi:hypothetical protein TB2_026207 [Malus domestica]
MLKRTIGLSFSRERVICESSSRKYVHHFLPGLLVNTQTTVKVKVVNKAEDEPESFAWSWRPETIDDTRLLAMGEGTANQLMDQKEAGNDSGDSLWYMTRSSYLVHKAPALRRVWESVHLKKYEPIWSKNMALRVNDAGFILLAYVKGEYVGSQWAQYYVFNYVFEKNVKLHPGKNIIPLWSATVGFPATFKAPLGTDPIAVDLQGKGHAWISGHSIGRYWPSYLSYDTGCSLDACAYCGSYDNKKYSFNCGNPTQRWYHVPRSFMQDGENTIVLFEEFGGNPSLVNFLTIQVGAVCAHAYENHTVELACEGRPILQPSLLVLLRNSYFFFLMILYECVGKGKCSIDVSDSKFGSTNCGDAVKWLAVEAVCE